MARRRPVVSYLTAPQAPGDLDLEAQRQVVEAFARANGYRVVEEYVDDDGAQEAPALGDWSPLQAVLDRARQARCAIVVAALECLSRDARVAGEVATRGVPIVVAGESPFTLRPHRGWTRRQRERHGRKIKSALAARKAAGVRLGNPTNLAAAGAAGRAAQVARTDALAAGMLPVIQDIRAGGVTSFAGIAEELNRRGIGSPRGGRWLAMTVRRVVERGRRTAGS